MRYIGNKTKLLQFIGDFLREQNIRSGRVLDAFSGTASVGSFLKSKGFTVVACDILAFSYVLQRAYVVADRYPQFLGLCEDRAFQTTRATSDFVRQLEARFKGQRDLFCHAQHELRPLEEVLLYLDTWLEPLSSFITKHYSPAGEGDEGPRMYFTADNARKIDAVRHQIHEWHIRRLITDEEYYVLLAALLEAADAVANTTGVYAAFVKTWQTNALKPLRLPTPPLVANTGLRCEAHQADVNAALGALGPFDLLYLDPPYNTRQYSAYYHVPELIAEGWFERVPVIRGRTGLIPDGHKKSRWCSRETCIEALEDLLARASAAHVLMSYNSEGIILEKEIAELFRSYGEPNSYVRVSRAYSRYRADVDSAARRYKADETVEYLYHVRLTGKADRTGVHHGQEDSS